MKKKLLFIGILLMSIFISSSKCSDDDKEEHKYITIINLSNKAIVWQPQMVKIGEVDAQYACQKISKIIPGNSTYKFDNGSNIGEEEFITHYLQFILMDEEIYSKYSSEPCDTIRKYVPILHCYQLTKEDLERMNWTVTYP